MLVRHAQQLLTIHLRDCGTGGFFNSDLETQTMKTMIKRMRLCGLVMTCAAMMLMVNTHADPGAMTKHVPHDALAFFVMSGTNDQATLYDQSVTKKLLVNDGMFDTYLEKFESLMEAEGPDIGDEDRKKFFSFMRNDLPKFLGQPSFGYVTAFTKKSEADDDEPNILGRIVFAIQATDAEQRTTFTKWFNELEKAQAEEAERNRNDGPQPTMQRIDTPQYLGMIFNFPETEKLAKPNDVLTPAKSIQNRAAVMACLKQVMSTKQPSMYSAWVDIEAIIEIAKAKSGEQETITQVMQAYGLGDIKTLAFSQGFDAQGQWFTNMFLDTPAPRHGVIAAYLETPAITNADLKAIPKNATWMRAGTWDLPGMLNAVREAQAKVPEDMKLDVDAYIAQVNEMAGFDVEKSLVDGLGPCWVAYSDASTMTMFGPTVSLANKTRDPQAVTKALDAVQVILNTLYFSDPDSQMKFTKSKVGDIEMNAFNLMMVVPTWAMVDGYLIVGLSPQAVSSFAMNLEQNNGGITANPEFQKVRASFPKHVNSLMYTDLKQTAPQMYQLMNQGLGMMAATEPEMAQMYTDILPPLSKLQPYLQPIGYASWTDENGWHYSDSQPFPGAAYLSPELAATQISGSTGLVQPMAILLPALGAARQTARQMTSQTQLRGIHQACVTFAQSNRERYPDELYPLLKGNYFTIEFVVSPTMPAPPADFRDWPEKKQQNWIRANASYVLVPGMTDDLDSQKIALFEKPDHSARSGSGEIGVTFNDGHTEIRPVEEAKAMLKKQTGKTMMELIQASEKQVK